MALSAAAGTLAPPATPASAAPPCPHTVPTMRHKITKKQVKIGKFKRKAPFNLKPKVIHTLISGKTLQLAARQVKSGIKVPLIHQNLAKPIIVDSRLV